MRRASVSPLAARSESGNAMQIDVEHLVGNPPRSATHLGESTAFARHQFIMLKALHRLFPFAPRRTGPSIGGNHSERATRRAPDEKGALYAVGMCTASSYFMKKTSSYRHHADHSRPV